jgi:hypothetical protein
MVRILRSTSQATRNHARNPGPQSSVSFPFEFESCQQAGEDNTRNTVFLGLLHWLLAEVERLQIIPAVAQGTL